MLFLIQKDQKRNQTDRDIEAITICLCRNRFPSHFSYCFSAALAVEMFVVRSVVLRKSVDGHTVHDKTHDFFFTYSGKTQPRMRLSQQHKNDVTLQKLFCTHDFKHLGEQQKIHTFND